MENIEEFTSDILEVIQYESGCLVIENLVNSLPITTKESFHLIILLDDVRETFLELI